MAAGGGCPRPAHSAPGSGCAPARGEARSAGGRRGPPKAPGHARRPGPLPSGLRAGLPAARASPQAPRSSDPGAARGLRDREEAEPAPAAQNPE